MRKNCSSDPEKLLKFEAEGREFAKILRLLEQFIQTVKGLRNMWKKLENNIYIKKKYFQMVYD